MTRYAIRAPDHLGDATMALPAMRAIAALGPCVVHGPRFLGPLFEATGGGAPELRAGDAAPSADVGVLLKPSLHAAWRWRGLARRIGLAENARGLLLTDALPVRPDEHRRDGYARVAAALGAPVGPRVPPRRRAGRTILLNPWSPTATVRWPYFGALADALAAELPSWEVIVCCGPGEADAVRALVGGRRLLDGLPLPDFARALTDAAVFVSNDSGAAHLADALGVPVVMVHGSTDPARTGAGEAVHGGPIACGPCYRKRCPHALACLTRIPVADVVARVRARLDRLPVDG